MDFIVWRIVGVVATFFAGLGLNALMLPAWDGRDPSMWGFLLLILAIGSGIQLIIDFIEDDYFLGIKIGGGAMTVVLVVLAIGGLTSCKMFNATKYKDIITMEEGNFEEDVNPIENTENISIVDMKTAQRLGDRTIGSITNAAWYEVDNEYNLIRYQGQLYRISPLNYGGYFKAQKAKYDGIPGYVLVNTSTQEAQYVQLEKGMKYSPSAYWSFDLKRHIRGQYPGCMLSDSFFEIDEEGNPYWITAVNKATIGMFGGKKEVRFIITNACTGESAIYGSEELPEWVDQAYGLEYLTRVAGYNLLYVNGYWNASFAKTNVAYTSYKYRGTSSDGTFFDGYNTVITANGEIVFYTGLTPASNAEANIGFLLLNPKTGVITRYECSGAEESSAQASAESLVQDLKYEATFPTILNVEGEETYFLLLKDKAGLVQRYALCNVENYTKVVQAPTLEEAVELYLVKLGKQEAQPEQDVVTTQTAEGVITELYEAQTDGSTYYYFRIEGSDNLYMSWIKNSNKQVLLKVGTNVSIEYVPTTEEGIFIVQKIHF